MRRTFSVHTLARPSLWALTLALALACTGQVRAGPSPDIQDPHYGDTLFHFFQDRYFSAVTTLTVSFPGTFTSIERRHTNIFSRSIGSIRLKSPSGTRPLETPTCHNLAPTTAEWPVSAVKPNDAGLVGDTRTDFSARLARRSLGEGGGPACPP